MRVLSLFYSIVLATTTFLCSCQEKKALDPIYGSWSARYIYLEGNDLLGYFDDSPTFVLKPTYFSEDGKMTVFEVKKQSHEIILQANFSVEKTDSIKSLKLESTNQMLSGVYKMKYKEENGKTILLLTAVDKEMYFERSCCYNI